MTSTVWKGVELEEMAMAMNSFTIDTFALFELLQQICATFAIEMTETFFKKQQEELFSKVCQVNL